VDDWYGASRSGLKWTAGKCIDLMAELMGLRLDDAKTENDLTHAIILGTEVETNFELQAFYSRLEKEKSRRWRTELKRNMKSGKMEIQEAQALGGRAAFAVTQAGDKVGRAYARPVFAQANAPLPGCRIGEWLQQALVWWNAYFKMRPVSVRSCMGNRAHATIWVDASGTSRGIGALCTCSQWGPHYFYTDMIASEQFMQQLDPRGDKYIAILEMLAICVGLWTWRQELEGAAITVFCDNQVALHSFIRGSSASKELNQLVGCMWLEAARHRWGLHLLRVESEANPADGPSRQDYELMKTMGAIRCPAAVPGWANDIWAFEAVDGETFLDAPTRMVNDVATDSEEEALNEDGW